MSSSKLELVQKTNNRGKKTFEFTLRESSQDPLVLKNAPDGWGDSETTYTRHETYHSVLRNTSTAELTFYKEGRDFIKRVYENSGIDANISFTVKKLNKETYLYESYPAANKIDLSTYDINEIGVSVQLIDTPFKEKIINRDSTPVDLLKRVSIEGLEMTAFDNLEIIMPDTSITLASNFSDGSPIKTDTPHVVPLIVDSSDFPETQAPTDSVNSHAGAFFRESTRPRILSVHGTILGDLQFTAGTGSYEFTIVHIDIDEVIKNSITIKTDSSGISPLIINFSYDESFTLEEGDSLCLQCSFTSGDTGTDRIIYATIDHNADEIFTGTPEVDVRALPTYEAFLRAYQLTSDQEDCFKSDKFGRTDTPIITYGSDGELGYVTRGIYFRQTDNVTDSIAIKSKDLFKSYSSIFRLGLGTETAGGVTRVRIEDRDYFYNANVVLDLSDRIRGEDIEKQVIPDMFFKSIETGFNKFEYEETAGLFEFNTKSSWTTVIKTVFNDLRKIVTYRGDGQGMIKIIRAPQADDYDPTEDVKGDNDIFLIDAVRDNGNFIARTQQGFVTNSIKGAVYASASFNVRYAPGRILRTWGTEIKAGLIHNLNSLLRWQVTDTNSTLQSQLLTESSPVIENADVLVDDLNDNRWFNEKYIVKAPLSTVELNAFDANPDGLIKLSDTKYGWIVPGGSMKTTNKDGMAEFELLRTNLNNVTPIP